MQVVSNPSKPPAYQGRSPRRPTRWNTFSLALAVGLAAALLTFLLVRGRLSASAAVPAQVPVVVAARDIPARTRLTTAWLRVRQASPADIPDDAAQNATELAGKVTTEPIAAGKAVLRSAVTAAGAALGMAFALPPSQRAVTLTLDPADSSEQFVRPGDHVDILATDEPGSGPAEARTVLQNVRLLAVGAQTSPDAAPSSTNGPAHVTVAVSPAQAQALVLAAARGKIHLALRAADDEAVVSLPAFPAAPPAREAARSMPPRPRSKPHRIRPAPPVKPVEETLPLPPLPVHLPPAPPAHITVTVIKGSQSQTVSVEP